MRIVFVSNYFNHHQKPLCEAFSKTEGVDFCFYQTEPMEEERVRMGWGIEIKDYPYVKLFHDDEDLTGLAADVGEKNLPVGGTA